MLNIINYEHEQYNPSRPGTQLWTQKQNRRINPRRPRTALVLPAPSTAHQTFSTASAAAHGSSETLPRAEGPHGPAAPGQAAPPPGQAAPQAQDGAERGAERGAHSTARPSTATACTRARPALRDVTPPRRGAGRCASAVGGRCLRAGGVAVAVAQAQAQASLQDFPADNLRVPVLVPTLCVSQRPHLCKAAGLLLLCRLGRRLFGAKAWRAGACGNDRSV